MLVSRPGGLLEASFLPLLIVGVADVYFRLPPGQNRGKIAISRKKQGVAGYIRLDSTHSPPNRCLFASGGRNQTTITLLFVKSLFFSGVCVTEIETTTLLPPRPQRVTRLCNRNKQRVSYSTISSRRLLTSGVDIYLYEKWDSDHVE